jgi:hypothetical protein
MGGVHSSQFKRVSEPSIVDEKCAFITYWHPVLLVSGYPFHFFRTVNASIAGAASKKIAMCKRRGNTGITKIAGRRRAMAKQNGGTAADDTLKPTQTAPGDAGGLDRQEAFR